MLFQRQWMLWATYQVRLACRGTKNHKAQEATTFLGVVVSGRLFTFWEPRWIAITIKRLLVCLRIEMDCYQNGEVTVCLRLYLSRPNFNFCNEPFPQLQLGSPSSQPESRSSRWLGPIVSRIPTVGRNIHLPSAMAKILKLEKHMSMRLSTSSLPPLSLPSFLPPSSSTHPHPTPQPRPHSFPQFIHILSPPEPHPSTFSS